MESIWPMFGHDVFHTCRSIYSTENNSGIEIWRVGGNNPGAVWGSAVVDNEKIIYFGTQGSDSSLYAMYPDGTRKWRFHATGTICCSPAIAEDGTLFFTTWGGYGYLHAVYPNGTQKWFFDGDHSSSSSPTIGSDGTIYFGNDGHLIFAVNPDGTEKWRYTTGYIVMGSPAIGPDGTIYIGSSDYYLYALYPNGTLRWRYNTGAYIKGSASIADDGTIYVPSFNGYFYALNPNGTLKWQASTGGSVAAAGIALAEDGTIYVGTEQLRAYYPNGTLKWCTDVQGSIYGSIPAVSGEGTIYVSAGGSLVAVNPDGTEKWRKQLTTAQIRSSPSIGPDDRVYVGSEEDDISPYGYLSAFGNIENNQPPEKPTINGPTEAKKRTSVTYVFQANDTDNTPISYYVDWGDDTNEQTIDYMQGYAVSLKHTWTKKGTYTIKAKAIDSFGLESDWATLTVIMPYEPPQFPFLHWLLERFPNAFPILRQIMGY
ncbi:MAG: PQQ-binding-like beta-propeller repeat protein [Candidatus Thermoplasmatota archaeon]|nr:PQQ-binding-like beta-propeller repeat protein [Candidatus Thermoplasmatota archaeon]